MSTPPTQLRNIQMNEWITTMDCVNPSKVGRRKWDYCTHPFIHPPPLWALQLEDQWPRLRAREGEGYALWRHSQILEHHLIHQTIVIVLEILQLHMVCDLGLHASSVWIDVIEDGELLWPQDCVETLAVIETYLCLLINYGSSRRLYLSTRLMDMLQMKKIWALMDTNGKLS